MPQEQLHSRGTVARPVFQVAQGVSETASDNIAAGRGEEPKHHAGEIPSAVLLFTNSIVVVLFMVLFALYVRSKLKKIPTGIANFAEFLVESLNNFTVGIIGPGGEKHTPFVGTVFLYILTMNLIGVIPGLHSPTGNLSITFALGLVTFCYVQWTAIRENGVGGYIKHLAGPMPALAPLMFPLELISEIVKPFTLAIRLFGNIFGEDVIIGVVAALGLGSLATRFLPFQFPILLLSLLTDFVQAMIFATLTCIYISLVAHHEHADHEVVHGVGAHAESH